MQLDTGQDNFMFQKNSKKSIETTAKVIVSNCKVKSTNKIDAIYVAFS